MPLKNVKVIKEKNSDVNLIYFLKFNGITQKYEEKPKLKNIDQKSTESKRSGKELWSSANMDNLREKGLIQSKKVPENFTDSILFDLVEGINGLA